MLTTVDGRRVGVVTHHADGRRELIFDGGSDTDPDAMCSLTLSRREALALARLLGMLDVTETP
ncbi:potassium transporter TrkA [Rhizomonospora bruguierae]|uniref:potassium transporter TrkA n=1 Tax=Rhizomonospora bruguierae TaxID=1581705 RepID=UPI0020BF4D80|nr:potassium transporter TrkA [Micromonospora sp. NBRC 107566]